MPNYVQELRELDYRAKNDIIKLLKEKGITTLDVSNKDYQYEDLFVYNYGESVKIDTIILEDDLLLFVDSKEYTYSSSDFHDGTMPYIYAQVETIIGDLNTEVEREYEVYLYYHGCYSTNVKATNKDEALQIARRQISDMSEVEFLSAIEAQENDYDVCVSSVKK
jgi:hypothetical protein